MINSQITSDNRHKPSINGLKPGVDALKASVKIPSGTFQFKMNALFRNNEQAAHTYTICSIIDILAIRLAKQNIEVQILNS